VPRPHIAMRKIRDALRLTLGEGLGLRQVAASLGLPHTTVANYARRAKGAGLTWPLPADMDDDALEAALFAKPGPFAGPRPVPDWEKVHMELRRPGVTLMLLWHEHKEQFPDGYSYTQFTIRYKAWARHLGVVMRQKHRAGEKLFVDFPGRKIPIYEANSGQVGFEAELFVAAMGASSYLYAEAFPSQELLYWVTAHVHAFEAMGACPAIVVCDNLRSGVTRPHRYEPDVNATYSEMAAHYGVAVIPARAYKPRDKAKAENGVLLAERWVMARLRDRHFTSIGAANEAIAELVAWVNARPYKRLPGSRATMFAEVDRPAMKALPAARYEFAVWKRAKVSLDYHIELRSERHYYSVPFRLVGEVVDVRTSAATIEVFYHHNRVASHVRRYRPGYTTEPAHMPESHRRHAGWTPARIVAWAGKAGPSTAKFAEAVLASRPHPEQGFRTCLGIVRLGERYNTERLEAACTRALALRSYTYRSVESILRHGLDKAPLPGNRPEAPAHPHHGNLRGPGYYA
jgi:transposase